MSDELCPGFEPQGYLKERCKRCFRLKQMHPAILADAIPAEKTGATPPKRSWRARVYGNGSVPATNGPSQPATERDSTNKKTSVISDSATAAEVAKPVPTPKAPDFTPVKLKPLKVRRQVVLPVTPAADAANGDQLWSPPGRRSGNSTPRSPRSDDEMSFKSARSGRDSERQLSEAMSFESLPSTDGRSMATAQSGGSSRSSTPTEQLDERDGRVSARSVRLQLETMERKCERLERQNAHLTGGLQCEAPTNADGLHDDLREKLVVAEALCQDYRSENSVLKCELEELQEKVSKGCTAEAQQLKDKLTAAESLCEELMEENEPLKAEIRELQNDIEEMQDQYREEEIEEFRELQAELEQTAKNCRVLQFKLRKAERSREQTEADRQHLEEKLKELMSGAGLVGDISDSRRTRELESELRVAKEVSVRLHNELEGLEDKRCKLEDENFCLKEKVRELETREKLGEIARQKYEHKRHSKEMPRSPTSSADYNVPQLLKDLQDALERETDVRDQLKFAEHDIEANRRKTSDLETENDGLLRQLAKLTSPGAGKGRPPMTRSASFSEGHAQIQLEMAEHEVAVLKSRLAKLEKENEQMAARMSLLERELRRTGGKSEFSSADLGAVVPDTYYRQKIRILEEENDELRLRLEDQLKPEAERDYGSLQSWRLSTRSKRLLGPRSRSLDAPDGGGLAGAAAAATDASPVESRSQVALAEQETALLRQRVSHLDAQNERLAEENKRMKVLSRSRNAAGGGDGGGGGDERQPSKLEQMQRDVDRFVARINDVERENSSLRKQVDRLQRAEVKKRLAEGDVAAADSAPELIKESKVLNERLKTETELRKKSEQQLGEMKHLIGQSENQKLVLMATKVEVIGKQLRQSEERYAGFHRKLAGAGDQKRYADALKERVEELERQLAEAQAAALRDATAETPPAESSARGGSALAEGGADENDLSERCRRQNEQIDELRRQLELAQHDKEAAEQRRDAATHRLLQTEERWNRELEKLRESYESQLADLKYYMQEAESSKEEKTQQLAEKNRELNERNQKIMELEPRVERMQEELRTKYRDLQERLDGERRKARDFETKHQKLEKLFDAEKARAAAERDKLKAEASDARKQLEREKAEKAEAQAAFERQRVESATARAEAEARATAAEAAAAELEARLSQRAADLADASARKADGELKRLRVKVEADAEAMRAQRSGLEDEVAEKTRQLAEAVANEKQALRETGSLRTKVDEQRAQLELARQSRDEALSDLSKRKEEWSRDRADLTHKMRKDEKLQQTETSSLQLKYESRLKAMEETSKNLQTQLAQSRRDGESHRGGRQLAEKRLSETQQAYDGEVTSLKERVAALEQELDERRGDGALVASLRREIDHLNEVHDADKQLWQMSKTKDIKSAATKRGSSPSSRQEPSSDAASAKLAERLRRQIDQQRAAHAAEAAQLNEQLQTVRATARDQQRETAKSVRQLQDQQKVVEIDRRNVQSGKETLEGELIVMQSERDAANHKLQEIETHYLANKYKLDRIAETLSEVSSEDEQGSKSVQRALTQLAGVREDLARCAELERFTKTRPVGAQTTRKSTDSDLSLTPRGGDALKKSASSYACDAPPKPASSSDQATGGDATTAAAVRKATFKASRSLTSDISSWESRIAELRKRTPSPSPRKLTNYPEAPPSIVLNSTLSVEYDKEGRRQWIPRELRRSASASLQPVVRASDDSCLLTLPRNHGRDVGNADGASSAVNRPASTEPSARGPQRPTERRSLFALRKSHSVETSEVARRIGAIGMHALLPGVSAANLPESVTSSAGSGIDQPPTERPRRSGSVTRLLERWRAGSRRSTDGDDEPPRPQPAPARRSLSDWRARRAEASSSSTTGVGEATKKVKGKKTAAK